MSKNSTDDKKETVTPGGEAPVRVSSRAKKAPPRANSKPDGASTRAVDWKTVEGAEPGAPRGRAAKPKVHVATPRGANVAARGKKAKKTAPVVAAPPGPDKYGLPHPAQLFVVESLACYVRPVRVLKELSEEFKITISKQGLQHYDPTKPRSRLSTELRAHFEETRAEYLKTAEKFGLFNQVYRIERLQDLLDDALDGRNPRLVMDILEKGALEAGGRYTNKTSLEVTEAQKFLADAMGVTPDQLPPPTPPNARKK